MRQRASLPIVVAVSVAVLAFGVALAGPPEPAAIVAWPPSGGLLVGEVVTGGTSASDEFVEVYNASPAALDLGGLELVYVTSTGGTVTRKATWVAGTMLQSGRHLLVANASGSFAPVADALYSGGFAATGGALVLRPIGGTPIDAVAWGDATNAFVEGTAAAAPPAGQSIERRPGGLSGNATDTNDNARDSFVNPTPAAQNLAAPPVPAPQATATPQPTESASSTPQSTETASSTPQPTETTSSTPQPTETPVQTADPTATPITTPTPSAGEPTPVPSETPAATASGSPEPTVGPTPIPPPPSTASPTPTPPPTPTPTATPSVVSVAQARAAANGQAVDVIATLTTPAGLLESGTGAFIQDETAGISVYLASADWPALVAGTVVRVHGTVDDRYSQRTIRVAAASDVVGLVPGVLPDPVDTRTGAAGEGLEGSVVSVLARVVAAADTLTDGFAVTVDDGSGELRGVASAASGIVASELPAQSWFRLTGALGQRDSSGTGSQGYRLYLRWPLDIVSVPQPTPTPSPVPTDTPTPSGVPTPSAAPTPPSTPAPTPAPTPPPTATPTASASPSPSPSPLPSPTSLVTIAVARAMPLDSVVTVEGVATVEAGRIIDAASTVIQDQTTGIAVRLPSAGWPAFARGDLLRVQGVIGQRYGNLELRPTSAGSITVLGHGVLPAARPIAASELGEAIEGRLVRCSGIVVSVDALGASGNFGLDLKDATGTLRVFVYGTTGIGRDAFPKGATVEVTGIEGQHAPSLGSALGHRLWPRDRADVRTVATTPPPGSSPSPTASPSPGSHGRGHIAIATAIQVGGDVTIEGTVTTPPGFVDADGRRLVVEDDTGALLVRLPADTAPPAIGTRIVASGAIGSYYGSPQLALSAAPEPMGTAGPTVRSLTTAPGVELAWRLVRVSGTIASVHRLGTTWRAELALGSQTVPIYGAARSGIASTALVEGRNATVTGIVRPPYPTATDRRPAIAPRFAADVSLGGSAGGGMNPEGGAGGPSGGARDGGASAAGDAPAPLDLELGELGDHEGVLVRVGGLVVSAGEERVVIDDGTGTAAVLLPAEALGIAGDLRAGDPLNAVGTVVRDAAGWAVAPRSVADIARVGRLGELAPLVPVVSSSPDPSDGAGEAPPRLGSHSDWPIGTLPTLVAVAGTALTMAFRRREMLEIGRRIGGLVGQIVR